MRLHVVGSGCPQPGPNLYGSCIILEAGGALYMVDCGPAATGKMVAMGIRPLDVETVFFTHHHSDHNVDFPCFALTRWDASTGTEPPLQVYGPPPTHSFVDRLLSEGGAFFEDWKARVEHPASHYVHQSRKGIMPRPPPAVTATDIEDGYSASHGDVRVTAVQVHHVEPWLISLAYRFDTPAGSVVFAGDCGDCPALRQLAHGVDTLVVACGYKGDYQPVLGDVITAAPQAAAIAVEAGARRVVLTHANPSMLSGDAMNRAVAEVAEACGGDVTFPAELTTLDLIPA